jgi:hypothetical protein
MNIKVTELYQVPCQTQGRDCKQEAIFHYMKSLSTLSDTANLLYLIHDAMKCQKTFVETAITISEGL